MSVDTNAKLHKSVTIKEIEIVIARHYELKDVKQYDDHFWNIYFGINEHQRNLSIFIGKNRGNEPDIENHLSLGQNDEAIEVMKIILSYFGGWLDENDCDDNDFYWVEKTRSFDDKIKTELSWNNYVNLKLNSVFTYKEIQKILENESLIREVFGSDENSKNEKPKLKN